MGISVVADDNRAVLFQNTRCEAFGPTIGVPGYHESDHRKVAHEVIDRCNAETNGSVVDLWFENPDRIREIIKEVKADLYPETVPGQPD